MSFLKAEWRKLAIANYEVDGDLLSEYIPWGTELDLWHGKCFISLVGFMFVNTKLLGIRIPYHQNFEEVNLRFYVKRLEGTQWKRGVVFIKEIVPRKALSVVANYVYNENYEALPMEHFWEVLNGEIRVEYRWKRLEKWHRLQVISNIETKTIPPDSDMEFITEHYWGYARVNDSKTNEYEVTHPRWEAYQVRDYAIDVDFRSVYGVEFGFLNSLDPVSVMLVEGSEITVENKRTISK